MKLKDYLDQNGIKTVWFASKIPITKGYLSAIMNRGRKVSPIIAIRIAEITKGEVTAEDFAKDGQYTSS